MCAKLLQLLGHGDVILERIFWPAFVKNISGVANRRLADGAGLQNGVDCDAHILDRVERIEDTEDIDALLVGLAHKFFDDVIGIRRVTHRVRAAKQHLEANVGNAPAQLAQPLPGIFVQKTQSRVEGCAAPHLDAEKIREPLRDGRSGGQKVVGTHAGRHQGLMRVAQRRVGDQQALLLARPRGEFFRSQLLQQLPRARGRRDSLHARQDRLLQVVGDFLPFNLRIAVENHIA